MLQELLITLCRALRHRGLHCSIGAPRRRRKRKRKEKEGRRRRKRRTNVGGVEEERSRRGQPEPGNQNLNELRGHAPVLPVYQPPPWFFRRSGGFQRCFHRCAAVAGFNLDNKWWTHGRGGLHLSESSNNRFFCENLRLTRIMETPFLDGKMISFWWMSPSCISYTFAFSFYAFDKSRGFLYLWNSGVP